MKSVLISIQPKWCELIASGKKTVEVRKTKPKLETPFKCYIYCTNTKPYLVWGDVFRWGSFETEFTHLSGYNRKDAEKIWDVFNGKVIGEFVCDKIYETRWVIDFEYGNQYWDVKYNSEDDCLTDEELAQYIRNKAVYYGWHISDLVIYDEPKELGEFFRECDYEKDCGDCKYLHVENTPSSYETWCEVYEHMPLKKPPQSWCYVEEGGER